MRKWNFSDAIDKYFKLGNKLNQRDTIAITRTVSGLLKLLFPNGEFDKEAVRQCLQYALEVRRCVKEQLKKIGGMEFYDVHFSYIALSGFIVLCSGLLGKPVQSQMVILGDMSLGGSIIPVENLAETLQVAFNAGAKRILLPMSSVGNIPSVPGELFAKFQTSFYADPVDAVFKALGVD